MFDKIAVMHHYDAQCRLIDTQHVYYNSPQYVYYRSLGYIVHETFELEDSKEWGYVHV